MKMDRIRYRIVFNGDLCPGVDLTEAKRLLGDAFHLEPERVERLFSGKPVTVRKDVDLETAEKYQARFRRSGAMCRIVPESPSFPAQDEQEFRCSKCGFVQPAGAECARCGVVFQKIEASQKGSDSPEVSRSKSGSNRYPLQFTGSASEYFRIWIVNLLLTIVTLGIYAAWAKVRTRRYFYANTVLAGDGFDYLADPKAIFRGNLIIAGGILLFAAAQYFNLSLQHGLIVLFAMLFPWLVYKSLRFFAHNSAFRNVRFRFLGRLKDSYLVYLLLPILTVPTLGLIFPYLTFRQKQYFFGNMAFGATANAYAGMPGMFYKFFLLAFLIMAGAGIVLFAGMSVFASMLPFLGNSSSGVSGYSFVFIIMGLYLFFLLASTLFRQYLFASITNYCWTCSVLGAVKFESTLKTWDLIKIKVTNLLAIILSLGLLFPWAKVRSMRYMLENLTLVSDEGLDHFRAAAGQDISAIGESAADFFDFEVGL